MIIGGMQKHQAKNKDGICPCLCSSMGTGGGYVPMVIIDEIETDKQRNMGKSID